MDPTPYTIVIDTREQLPLAFATPIRWAHEKHPMAVATVRACLPSGDYSLLGYETQVAVERKSIFDLFSTLGQGRRRFICELERLAAYRFAAVVVEAEWSTILQSPPPHSRLNPKTVFMSVVAWQMRYPRVAWWFVAGRAMGEVVVARLLDRWYREFVMCPAGVAVGDQGCISTNTTPSPPPGSEICSPALP